MMTFALRSFLIVSCMSVAAACSNSPGEIKRDGEAFTGIAVNSSITVLGTEPFWNLSIDPQANQEQYQAVYSTPDDIAGTSFAVRRFAGNNGLGFSGELDGETFNLALTPGDCTDGMSDRLFPYTATLALGERTLFGCAYTSEQPFIGDESP